MGLLSQCGEHLQLPHVVIRGHACLFPHPLLGTLCSGHDVPSGILPSGQSYLEITD